MDTLSDEIVQYIVSFISDKITIANCRQVNKLWASLVYDKPDSAFWIMTSFRQITSFDQPISSKMFALEIKAFGFTLYLKTDEFYANVVQHGYRFTEIDEHGRWSHCLKLNDQTVDGKTFIKHVRQLASNISKHPKSSIH